MSFEKKICIIGAGGFGREVLCCIMDIYAGSGKNIADLACFMVDDEHFKTSEILGVEVIPRSKFDYKLYDITVAIGDPTARKKVVESLPADASYATILHPSVVCSPFVEIGEGTIITAGCIITCDIKLGKHTHLNLDTTIGHDCQLGDYFTTAPGAKISGNCNFGECVYFGTNACVRQAVTICDNVTIGMGGVVVKNITEPGVYVGNPLTKLEKKS